jgi:hypothetical protein
MIKIVKQEKKEILFEGWRAQAAKHQEQYCLLILTRRIM